MTLYLKYRPQTIDELDLDGVRDSLSKIVQSKNIPHAFLFSGPRGAGKTSTARILAKIVNCDSTSLKLRGAGLREPCNECETCISITRGTSLDVIEIDAASNRGVDDIRSLRDSVKLSSIGGKKKIYIIDEAHMLTTEAANALLKTLEEPPDHVMFILATTHPDKLPDTIRSRCTNINFYKGSNLEIVRALNRVVRGEKFDIENGSLEELASLVDGSFREAHKLLEQLSFEGKITIENVNKLTSRVVVNPTKIISFLIKKDAKSALEEIDNNVKNGVNLKVYTTEIISILRKNLLLIASGEKAEFALQLNDVQTLIELFSEAVKELPFATVAQLPLELAVVKYCIDESKNIESRNKSKNENIESRIMNNESANQSRENVSVDLVDSKITNVAPEIHPIQNSKLVIQDSELEVVKIDNSDLIKIWQMLMLETKRKNTSVEALLRAAKPLSVENGILKIEVFYKFHKDKLESDVYRSLVEEAATSVLGNPTQIVCVLSIDKKRAADIINVIPPSSKDSEILRVAEEIFGSDDSKLPN